MADMWGAGQIHQVLCVGERWIGRALDAREAEMKLMIKGAAFSMKCAYHTIVTDHVLFPAGVNSVIFYLFWTCAPIVVFIGSFFEFVLQGSELTVSIALTVGSLLFAHTV